MTLKNPASEKDNKNQCQRKQGFAFNDFFVQHNIVKMQVN